MSTDPVEEAIRAFEEGRFVFVYDADGREEETDFFLPAISTKGHHVRQMRRRVHHHLSRRVADRNRFQQGGRVHRKRDQN